MAKDNSVFVIATIPKKGLVSILTQDKEEAAILGHWIIEQGGKDVSIWTYPMPKEIEETALIIDRTNYPWLYREVIEPLVIDNKKDLVSIPGNKRKGGRADMGNGNPTKLPRLTIEKIKSIKMSLLERNQRETAEFCGVSCGIVSKIATNKYLYYPVMEIRI